MERQKKRQKLGRLDPKFKQKIDSTFPGWKWSK